MQTECSTDEAPIVIGGVGGSGTRVVARAVQKAGICIGSDLNASLDNLTFSFLFKRQDLWPLEKHREEIQFALELFSQLERGGHELDFQEKEYLERVSKIHRIHHGRDWLTARLLQVHQRKNAINADAGWGWKEPNSHIFLPELFRFFPRMHYVHVVRDGQDMAFSKNQSQVKLWGRAVGKLTSALDPQVSFDYWCSAHKRVLGIMAQHPQQTILLNFDALCRDPAKGLGSLYEFLRLDAPPHEVSKQVRSIVPPESVGRHSLEAPLRIKTWQAQLLTDLGFE